MGYRVRNAVRRRMDVRSAGHATAPHAPYGVRRGGQAASRVILGTSALTAPERERVAQEHEQMIKDREREIARLTDEINRKG